VKAFLVAIFASGAIAFSQGTLACGRADSVDYCGPDLIAVIYATTAGPIYVQPGSAWTGSVCTPIAGIYAQLLPSAQNFKQVYALLISAKLSGYQVRLVMEPGHAQCTISYVTLQ
jgi:hypothetical protein